MVVNGGFDNRQARISDVEIIGAVQTSRIGRENKSAHFRSWQRHVQMFHHAYHSSVGIPSGMPNKEIRVAWSALNKSAAMSSVTTL